MRARGLPRRHRRPANKAASAAFSARVEAVFRGRTRGSGFVDRGLFGKHRAWCADCRGIIPDRAPRGAGVDWDAPIRPREAVARCHPVSFQRPAQAR